MLLTKSLSFAIIRFMKFLPTPKSEVLQLDSQRAEANDAILRIRHRLAEFALDSAMEELIGDEWKNIETIPSSQPYDFESEYTATGLGNHVKIVPVPEEQSNVLPFRRRA